MKKFLLLFFSLFLCCFSYAQAYQTIHIGSEPEYIRISSFQGIEIDTITYSQSTGFTITFFNSNYNNEGERNNYYFEWYLSYKGKRVSDYFSSSVSCRKKKTVSNIFAWPKSVPIGDEKYVTIQLGKEKSREAHDRRDDY